MRLPHNIAFSITHPLLIAFATLLGLSLQAPQHGKDSARVPRGGLVGPDVPRHDPKAAFAHRGATSASSTAGITTQDLNSGLTPLDLAEALVGPGIVVSNVTVILDPTAAGLFGAGLGPIGISNGILLSSGNIASVVGPNLADDTSTAFASPGDIDLDTLIPGYTTDDACVIEFDFTDPSIPAGASAGVQFQYVFTSEEYNEYVDSPFNDVFGFFLNGQNIAVLPSDLITPVSINNVNCGNPYSPPLGSNCEFFINNDLSDGGGTIDTEMDGILIPLSAIGAVVGPGPHHLKLAIADAGDFVLDSNVFIQGRGLVVQEEPTCLAPTPAIELGAEPVEGEIGALVTYQVVAISNDIVGTPAVTITGVTAEHANAVGSTCGTFFPAPVPIGVVHTLALPVSGQPAQTTFSWTPTAGEAGCWRFAYTLRDQNGLTHTCTVDVHVVTDESCFVLDFETEDDFTTPLGNGQHIDTEFGNLVRISGAGANAGPTIFDTTPGGPNDPALNDDMLIGHGNVLLLENDWYSWSQTVPGFFDFVTDDPHGGNMIFDFASPVSPRSMLLADINPPPNQGASVTLIDMNGKTRVYSIQPGWTGGYGNAGPHQLDLTTTAPQPGNGTSRLATATEELGFQQDAVVQMVVHMTGFGAIDDLSLCF